MWRVEPPRRRSCTLARMSAKLVLALGVALALVAPAVALASPTVNVQARFASAASYVADPRATPAVTYNRASVPVGSWASVTQSANDLGGMDVSLRVTGLRPQESYDAKVYTGRCTKGPDGAGAPFRNGPSKQSYAANEFWLDFKTDRNGRASVLTTHYWGIAKGQHANSVVITPARAHEPAACVTVPFKRLNPGW
jgi:Cu-Zn family superoxide dismutase